MVKPDRIFRDLQQTSETHSSGITSVWAFHAKSGHLVHKPQAWDKRWSSQSKSFKQLRFNFRCNCVSYIVFYSCTNSTVSSISYNFHTLVWHWWILVSNGFHTIIAFWASTPRPPQCLHRCAHPSQPLQLAPRKQDRTFTEFAQTSTNFSNL